MNITKEGDEQFNGGVEQRLARETHNLKVAGSNPAPATNHKVILTVEIGKEDMLIKQVYIDGNTTGLSNDELIVGIAGCLLDNFNMSKLGEEVKRLID